MAALLTAAGGQSHRSPGADSNPGERWFRTDFFSVLGMCRALPVVCCPHPALCSHRIPIATHAPLLKALRCHQLVLPFPSRCCWGSRGLHPTLAGVTVEEDRGDVPGCV